MLRETAARARRWGELPYLLFSCAVLTLLLGAAVVLVIIGCSGLEVATVARRVLPCRRPPGMGNEALRQFFNCPDNFAHGSVEQISAQTGPFERDYSLEWGICQYQWKRHRLYVVVDTRDHVVTRLRMSADRRQPQTRAPVWDRPDAPAGGPA